MAVMRHVQVFRSIIFGLLVLTVAAATLFVIFDSRGQLLLKDPHRFGEHVRGWVHHHRAVAPACYIAVYIAVAVVGLPVWWLQVLSGYGFGIVQGVIFTQIAATISATCIFKLSHWLGADWFHEKLEGKVARLQKINASMGHNGLLIVLGTRLLHFLPFGLSNYLFGLSNITTMNVVIGTLLGNIPAATMYVTLGASPHLMKQGSYIALLVAINLVLLLPLGVRYLKPQWFRKIGVE